MTLPNDWWRVSKEPNFDSSTEAHYVIFIDEIRVYGNKSKNIEVWIEHYHDRVSQALAGSTDLKKPPRWIHHRLADAWKSGKEIRLHLSQPKY